MAHSMSLSQPLYPIEFEFSEYVFASLNEVAHSLIHQKQENSLNQLR
jgi:hypothetical protein